MTGTDPTHGAPGQEPIVQRRNRNLPAEPATSGAERDDARERRAASSRGGDHGTAPPAATGPWAGPSPSGAEPADRLVEDARFGELYVLFVINLLLGLITLGIYRFWGKTRIRKYVWSHMRFRGERFEYAGTGGELFLGFIIVLAILGPPFFGFYIWIQLDPPLPQEGKAALLAHIGYIYLAVLGLMLLSFYFTHVAIFAAYRYRLTRTLWHGIRATVDGNAWVYGFMGLGLSMLNGLSLGWTQPWAHVTLLNYRFTRTKIGTQPVKGEMTTKGLYGPFAIAWVISFVVGIAAMIVLGIIISEMSGLSANGRKEMTAVLPITLVIAYLTIPMTWVVTVNWYRAALIRSIATTFSVDKLTFSFPVRGSRLLWFNVSNTLIILFTLGLLFPYVILRYARFIQRHLRIEGEIDYGAWRQSDGWRPTTGEGMAEFFGIGII